VICIVQERKKGRMDSYIIIIIMGSETHNFLQVLKKRFTFLIAYERLGRMGNEIGGNRHGSLLQRKEEWALVLLVCFLPFVSWVIM